MAGASTSSPLLLPSVTLHPLVLLSACDHQLRISTSAAATRGAGAGAQSSSSSSLPSCLSGGRAVGLLFGEASGGSSVEVLTCIDLAVARRPDGSVSADPAYVNHQKNLILECFPSYSVLGWYGVGSGPIGPQEFQLHASLGSLLSGSASQLLMVLIDPARAQSGDAGRSVPVEAFVSNPGGGAFISLGIPPVESSSSERITIEHLQQGGKRGPDGKARGQAPKKKGAEGRPPVAGDEGGSSHKQQRGGDAQAEGDHAAADSLLAHLSTQLTALTGLQERVQVLATYVASVRDGVLPHDRALTRAVAAVASSLPVNDGPTLRHVLAEGAVDAASVGLAASLVRGAGAVADLASLLGIASAGGGQAHGKGLYEHGEGGPRAAAGFGRVGARARGMRTGDRGDERRRRGATSAASLSLSSPARAAVPGAGVALARHVQLEDDDDDDGLGKEDDDDEYELDADAALAAIAEDVGGLPE